MDHFYKEINHKLETESLKLASAIEPQHKILLANSYLCMSECYRKNVPIQECVSCSENCHDKVTNAQRDIQSLVENIQGYLKNCIQECKIVRGSSDAELKTCINACTETTLSKFEASYKVAEDIMKKYNKGS